MDQKKKTLTMALTSTLLITSTLSYVPYPIYAQDSVDGIQDEESGLEGSQATQFSQEEITESETKNEYVDSTTEFVQEGNEEKFEVIDDVLKSEEKVNLKSGEFKSESESLNTIYVSKDGNDSNDGSEAKPFLTLKQAAEKVENNGTIVLLSDLTLTESVRIINKSVTINGNGHRVERGATISQVQDNARSTYNPALFEINNWNGDSGHYVLTFENIVLDDNGIAAGEVFAQQTTNSTGNADKVQDAMIASYTTNDIVLKQRTIVQNYGGMSAIRITGGANLYMEEGSVIQDTQSIERGHSDSGTGPAGAIWIQGGQLNMQAGSSIQDMIGRAIYLDGGNANVGGTISNISGRTTMWQGARGIAIHVRNKGKAVLSGHITKITANVKGDDTIVAIRNDRANFESTQESKIDQIQNMPVLFGNGSVDTIGGTVENCSFDYLFRATYNNMTFTQTALIQNNTCKSGDANAVVYSTNGANYIFNGQMINNDATYAFYIINHGGSASSLTMNEGAKLIGNGNNTGVFINASGCKFEMNGGEITNFSTGVDVRGKSKSPATFIMNGGHIHGNHSRGVYFHHDWRWDDLHASEAIVQLNGGTVENNGENEVHFKMFTKRTTDKNEYISIAPGVIQGNYKIKLSFETMTLNQNYPSFKVGQAKTDAVNAIKQLISDQHSRWKVAGSSALWLKPSTDSFHFIIDRPSSVDTNGLGLYLAYIPLTEEGVPQDNAQLVLQEVANEEKIDVQLDNLTPNTSYAMMFVNNDTYHVAPKTTTIYAMGSSGTNLDGLPTEVDLKQPNTINSIEVDGETTTYTNKQQELAEEELKELFDYSYETLDGKELEDNTVAGTYVSKITFKEEHEDFKLNGDNVELEEGQLIIRYVSDVDKAMNGELDTKISNVEPTDPVQKSLAVVGENSSAYINGDSKRETKQDYIHLLDDELYGNVRKNLIQKGDESLQNTTDEIANAYDFHYLDLIDKANGNAFVTIKPNGTDTSIYLPYPEKQDVNTQFKILYFSDFNREYLMNNQPSVEDVAKSTQVSEIKCENTAAGIKFTLPEGQSGVYALVWQVDRSSLPQEPDQPSSGGTSSPNTVELYPVYRAYNPNNGEHFYTLDKKEFEYITSIGWHDEGIAFMADGKTSSQGLCEALYRVYNPNSGLHHYTVDEHERDVLVSLGWKDEGVAWYASTKPMQYPVYRLYNPNDGHHLYTMDEHEKDVLDSIGWDYEGIAFRTAPIETK